MWEEGTVHLLQCEVSHQRVVAVHVTINCLLIQQDNTLPSIWSPLTAVPSSPPMEVRVVPGGSNTVHVSWTPPTSGANGYLILYRPTSQVHNETVRIDNSTATSYIIESVMGQTVYTIQMLAYLELSTSLSNTVEIEIDGKYGHFTNTLFRNKVDRSLLTSIPYKYDYTCMY